MVLYRWQKLVTVKNHHHNHDYRENLSGYRVVEGNFLTRRCARMEDLIGCSWGTGLELFKAEYVAAIAPFTNCASCLLSWLWGSRSRFVIHSCCRTWRAVSRRWGSTCNIRETRSFADSDTVFQFPPFKVNFPLPIRANISSGVSSGPLANGVYPASIV